MDLEALEQRLRQQLDAGTSLTITLADLELPGLPDFLWPADDALALADAALERLATGELKISGTAHLPVLGEVAATLIARAGQPPVGASVQPLGEISLATLLKNLPGPFQVIGKLLDAIAVAAVDWKTLSSGALGIDLKLDGEYRAQLAGLALGLALDHGALEIAASGPDMELAGTCSIGGVTAPLTVQLRNGELTTSAALLDLSLRDLVAKANLPLPQLPGLDLLDRPLDSLEVLFRDDQPLLAFRYDTPAGPARCLVTRHDGQWCVVGGLHASAFKFASLNGALAPLDAFQSIVAFGDPVLSFATAPVTIAYRAPDGGWIELTFEEGFALRGDLKFDGFGLDLLKSLFGIDRLPLTLPIGADWSQIRLSATLGKPIRILGDIAVVHDLALSLAPDPQQISAAGRVTVTIAGTELPQFVLGASLLPGVAELFVLAENVWKEPLGIPVTVQQLGLQMTTGPSYGVLGEVILGDNVVNMAVQLTGDVPTMLAGELKGEMALDDILLQLADIRLLPSYFQPTVKDFALYIVLQPAGTSIAGRPYPFGLSLKGLLSFMGLGFQSDIHISKTQIRVIGELDDAIRLEPVFRFSGVDKPAPSLMVDTAADPIVALDGKVMFLGLEQAVRAVLGSSGFSTTVSQSFGGAQANLTIAFGHGRLAADGDAHCRLVGKIGPLKVPGTGIDLGSINLDTGAELMLHANAREGSPLDLAVTGRFSVAGLAVTLPEFKLDIASLADLPPAVLDYIRENAVALLADLLNDAGRWLQAILDGVIEGVENVARTMTEYFQKTAKEAADAMLNRLNDTMEKTAKALQDIGKTAVEIAQIFHELGRKPDDIADALFGIGIAPPIIADVLKRLGQPAAEVGRILERAGVPPGVIGVILGPLFPGVPIPFPVPHVKVPHLKHIKAPHLKHIKAPHLKHIKAPHIKF